MLIHYADGRILVGIILALTGSVLRVALRDEDDVAEYRLVNGQWISEDCEPVSFEFPLAPFQAAGIVPEGQGLNLLAPSPAPEDTTIDRAPGSLN